jgi:hypothetical protein
MWDMARFLGALYRVQDSNVASIVYKGQEYTWNESLGLHGSNWAYYDEVLMDDVTLVSVIADDFQNALITDTVNLTLNNADGIGLDVALTFAFYVPPTEQVVYSTGFEAADEFTAASVYNNTTEKLDGASGSQWATYYGTASTTSPLADLMSMQMRWYTSAVTNLGYTYTNFDTADVTKITFFAASTLGLNVEVTISTDGGATWIEAQTFTLTGTSTEYTYNVPVAYQTGDLRVKFTIVLPDPIPTGTSRLYLDGVQIYGMR